MALSDWKANMERERETKDAFFAQNWLNVPIHAGEKDYHLIKTD